MNRLIKIFVMAALLAAAISGVAYADQSENYVPSNYLKRYIWTNGDIAEYLNEGLFGTYGRTSLFYTAATQTYKTYDWATTQVTLIEYAGVYSAVIGNPLRNDIVASEKRFRYIYNHNGQKQNLNTATNGWVMTQKDEYSGTGQLVTTYNYKPVLSGYQTLMVVDGSGNLIVDFGSGGLQKYNGTTWTKITSSNPETMVVSGTDLIVDFGSLGIHKYNGTTWTKIASSNPENMVVSGTDLIADFGSIGIHKYNGTTWTKIASSNPENMVVSGTDLIADFGSIGIYKYNGTTWAKITSSNPENMVVSGTDLIADFGSTGIYKYNGTTWTKITSSNPENMVVSGTDLIADFGSIGIYKYNGTTWAKITSANPETMVVSGTDLIVDFGSLGIHKYNGTTWTKITSSSPYIYNATSNRMIAKTLQSADGFGNVYYHYLDEDFGGQGYGRLDKQVLGTADGDNAIAYAYEYFNGSATVYKKYAYKTANYSDSLNPAFSTLIVTYTYNSSGVLVDTKYESNLTYYASGRLESKTLPVADADHTLYYHYTDTAGNKVNYQVFDGPQADGETVRYSEYDASDKITKKEGYDSCNYSNPKAPSLATAKKIWTYLYDASEVLAEKDTYYYASQRMESKTLTTADANHTLYYHYTDTAGNKLNYQVLNAAGDGGAFVYYSEYAADKITKKEGYDSLDYSDPKAPDLTGAKRFWTYLYDASEVLAEKDTYYYASQRMESKTLTTADVNHTTYYHYTDTAGNLVNYQALDQAGDGGAWGYYSEYTNDKITKKEGYDEVDYTDPKTPVLGSKRLWTYLYDASEVLAEKDTYYYDSQRLESKTLTAADVNDTLYYHYTDTAGNKLNYQVFDGPQADGETVQYSEYASDVLTKKEGYNSLDYSDPKSPDLDGATKLWTYIYNADGTTIKEKYTYYADGKMESKTLTTADANHTFYYHFTDTAGNKLDYQVFDGAQADGETVQYCEYTADVLTKKEGYDSLDYSDPKNPDLTGAKKIWTYIYDADGTTIKEKYTYYASGNLESKIIISPADHNTYFYYYDLPGFLVKYQAMDAAGIDGAWAYYYEYDADGTKTKQEGYTECNYADPKDPVISSKRLWTYVYDGGTGALTEKYTYYYDSQRLESKTLVTADAGHNVYFYYYDNDRHDLKYQVMDTEDGDGAYAYYCEYDADGTKIKQEGYNGCDYSDPKDPSTAASKKLWTYIFDGEDGDLTEKYTFYFASQLMESKTIMDAAGDTDGNVYYHYLDENWELGGLGRCDKQVCAEADGDGAIAYIYEYYADTDNYSTKHCYQICDYSDPKAPTFTNELVTYEFLADGVTVWKKTDNVNHETYWYISDDFVIKEIHTDSGTPDAGTVYTYFIDGGTWYTNTKVSPYDPAGVDPFVNGSCMEYHYNDSNVLIGADNWSYDRGTIWDLDSGFNVEQTITPDPFFAKGVNLPWTHYGYDIGIDTTPNAADHIGFSSDIHALVDRIRERQVDYIRVFLFNDMRSGITFDADGMPIGFTDKVYEDMQALIDVSHALGVRLMPVLLDYTMADNVDYELCEVGEHPDILTDIAKRSALVSLLGDFVSYFSNNETIYAWDVMNEPEEIFYGPAWGGQPSQAETQAFMQELVDMVHDNDADKMVTLGAQDRSSLLSYWTGLGLDLYQFHYYNYMETTGKGLDYDCDLLGLGKPVIIGEIDPTQDANNDMTVMEKLSMIYGNGYSGALFWEDDSPGYQITPELYAQMKAWIYTINGTSDEKYGSGHLKRHRDVNGDIIEYLDEPENRVTLVYDASAGTYWTYDWNDADTEVTVREYTGVYEAAPGADVRSDVQAGELKFTTVYDDKADYDVGHNVTVWKMLTKYDQVNGISYTYYYDSQRMQSKTLDAADAEHNIYFYFYDIAGDVVKYQALNAAGIDSAWAYYYEYDADGTKTKQVGYNTLDYSDPTDPSVAASKMLWAYIFDGDTGDMTEKYTYYFGSQRLESKTLTTAEADHGIYFYYYDVDGFRIKYEALDAEGVDDAWGYYFEYDADGTKTKQEGYTEVNYADPKNPVLSAKRLWTYEYNGDTGALVDKITYYYDSQRLESKTIQDAAGDVDGNVYYHYTDDAAGRIDKKVLAVEAADGTKGYYYEYYADGTLKKVIAYDNADYANPKDCVLSDQLWVKSYDSDGNQIDTITYYDSGRMESKTLVSADGSGNIYYHYLDEDFNSRGYGRCDVSRRSGADGDNCIEHKYAFLESAVVDRVLKKVGYINANPADLDNWLVIYNYYASADWRLEAKTYLEGLIQITETHVDNAGNMCDSKMMDRADQYGNVFYSYKDNTDFKAMYQIFATAQNWEYSSTGKYINSSIYTYYDANHTKVHYQYCYSDDFWGDGQAINGSKFVTTYVYNNDATNSYETKSTLFVKDTSDYNDLYNSDGDETGKRLELQNKVKAYGTTAQGYTFVSTMSAQTYDPNGLPNP